MRWRLLFQTALVLCVGTGCRAPAPKPAPPNRLVAADWSLRFVPAGGTGYLQIAHESGATLAELHHVRLVLGTNRQTTRLGLQSAERRGDTMVLSCAPHPDHDIEVHLRLGDAGAMRVELIDAVGLRSELCELTLDYELPELEGPSETWIPHWHPEPDQVAGDGSFHAPLGFVRRGPLAVALLPDLERLAQHRRVPQAMELDVRPVPRLRHGLVSHRPGTSTSAGFLRAAPIAVQGETLRFGHTLRVFQDADIDTSYELFRESWRRTRPSTRGAIASWDQHTREFFERAATDHWVDLSRGKGTSGVFRSGIALATDGRRGVDAWYSVRHQSLRTAYGLLLFGERKGRPDLVRKAGQSLQHALLALPRRSGLSPSVFLADLGAGRRAWLLDSKSAGFADHYHALDVATTYTWMMRLAAHFPEHRDAVLAHCRRAAQFFRDNQLPSGAFPSFYEEEYLYPQRDQLHDVSAETGSVALFLLDFGAAAADDQAIAAARKALAHIERLQETGTWHDSESARVAGPIQDPRSGSQRQGTLGLIHCALAVARFGELRPHPRWELLCDRLLGQLSRYQQIWSPPWIPGARFGGFGAGNFDHRWNDARQGLAALAFFAGYELTDDPQWLERGVAALEAGLESGALEYQPARDDSGPRSSLHWGRGTACTAAEIARREFGGAIVDMSRNQGYGIDSAWVESVETFANELHVRVLTRTPDLGKIVLRFRNVPDGQNRIGVTVNRQPLGSYTARELQEGIEILPAFVPSFRFAPPREISRHVTWRPRAIPGPASARGHGARLEVTFANADAETIPLVFDATRALLRTKDPIGTHRELPTGAVVRSRLAFEVAGETYYQPESGYRTSAVSEFRIVDPGEDDDLELLDAGRSRIRRFPDGSEFGRHAKAGGFTYRIPVKTQTNEISFQVRAAGRLRVRVGDIVLHEDKPDAQTAGARDVKLELADHRMWATGEIALRFESVALSDSIDIASIRYQSSGDHANTAGLGETTIRREPDRELRVVVQPLELVDRALDVDPEALRLTFFGGPDHEITPGANGRATFGSVARFVDQLSGGRTTFDGTVLPKRRWNVVAAAAADAKLPDTILQQVRSAHEDADVIVGILSRDEKDTAPLPRARLVQIGNRRVPFVFLPDRGADGAFLSCGKATATILETCYGFQPLHEPVWGNFGALALTGRDSHRPAGPCGINLARTGWSDHLFLERRDHEQLVLSPLASSRVGFVLDCTALPGRGRLFLEYNTADPLRPQDSGVLMYWRFPGERPRLRAVTGSTSTPQLLRLSATRPATQTPFHAGTSADLFREARSLLPATTMTGERLWDVHEFRKLGEQQATFDVRYLAEELTRDPRSRWLVARAGRELTPIAGAKRFPANAVRLQEGETWVTLPPRRGARVRLVCSAKGDPHRIFGRVRGVSGTTRVVIGSGENEIVSTELESVTARRWLQGDAAAGDAVWLQIENTSDTEARLALSSLLRVPRERPLHRVRPPRLKSTQHVRLMDGVTYGETLHLPHDGHKLATAKIPIVLPGERAALRLRVGLPHDAPPEAMSELTLTLVNSDGSKQVKLLDRQAIRSLGRRRLFLALAEIETGAEERVEFLELSWRGSSDLHVTDFAIVRLR